MKRTLLLSLVLGVGAAFGVRAALAPTPADSGELLAPPAAPHALEVRVLEAHPFTLETPEPNSMRPGAPAFTSGTLLVLEGPADRFLPRQTLENVLYVGTRIPAPFNVGAVSGRRVVVLPGEFDPTVPVFFGAPELPERVSDDEAARQLALALEAGARPIGSVQLEAARDFADGIDLQRFAADLIERFSPDEVDVVSGLRAKRL